MAFKRLRQMKRAVSATPDLVEQALRLQEQTLEMQATQQAAAAAAGTTGTIDPRLLEPIAGITIERYAELSKAIGERNLDLDRIENFVRSHGVGYDDWQAAFEGWNERLKHNTALSVHYADLYRQARSR